MGKPLSVWKLPIQPNSLVSVFSTVAKSALLVPIAECLSQLKWIYFEKPRVLSHIQVFDEASRGAWGALKLLWRTRGTAILASVGAIVTLLALAFEPFAQQVMEFSSRSTALTNITGVISAATAWSDANFTRNDSPSARFAFTLGTMSLMAGRPSVIEPGAYCSTSECRLPDFTSLAACTTCESRGVHIGENLNCSFTIMLRSDEGTLPVRDNLTLEHLTEEVKEHGSNITSVIGSCLYPLEGYPLFDLELELEFDPTSYGSSGAKAIATFDFRDRNVLPNEGDPFGNEYLIHENGTHDFDSGPLQYCIRRTNMVDDDFNAITRFTCFNLTSPIPYTFGVETLMGILGSIRGTLTWCRLDICAQDYHGIVIENGVTRAGKMNNTPLRKIANGTATKDEISTTGDPAQEFYIGNQSRNALNDLISNVTTSAEFAWLLHEFLLRSNWSTLIETMSTVLTAVIRSDENANVKNVTGTAFGLVVYVTTRWGWFVLPLLLVAMTTVFFVVTAFRSSRRAYLFRSFILATLFHGLEGWNDSEFRSLQTGVKGRMRSWYGGLLR